MSTPRYGQARTTGNPLLAHIALKGVSEPLGTSHDRALDLCTHGELQAQLSKTRNAVVDRQRENICHPLLRRAPLPDAEVIGVHTPRGQRMLNHQPVD
eukprot:7629075-Pyramimonas_sp.AAC.1